MIEYATVVGIACYIGLISAAPEQMTEILVGAGLVVSAYVIFHPAANLRNRRRIVIKEDIESTGSNRSCKRAECFIPVEVKRGRERRNEYVLNLSAGGIRLTSVDRPELDTDLQVSFRLPMANGDSIRARGRVVHQMSKRNADGRYEVGVLFDPIDPQCRKRINREVNRLLTA